MSQGKRSDQGYTMILHVSTRQCRTKYQLPTAYSFQDIGLTRFIDQNQRSNQGHTMTLHTCKPPN